MGINVKHTPAAVTFAAPAYLAGQEDLRRHMEKMDQQRAEMMLKAQQAREENAVKIAMQDAQINAQANNQRAGQMHDFQRMQFGAGLNAAQDKVNFDQQQAIQKAGQNFQAAENKKAQDAIAARMEQARQDQADAKAEYIKQQQEAAKKAEDQKQQDRLNALPVQTSRQIQEQNRSNALLSSIDVATGGMIPDVVKYDAANIINTQQSQKTPQQVARDTLLQTHDYSPADAKKMADAERKMAAIQAAIIEPEKKRAMLQPLEDLIQNTMPSVRRPKLSEQVEVDNNGATLSRAKDGSVKRTSPEKLNDVDKKYEVGQKAYDAATRLPGMTEERAKAIEAEAMQGYERDQQKSRELTIRVAKGEDEGKVRAELEQKYRSVAPAQQPAAPATAPQAPGQSAPVASPSGQQPAPPQGMPQQQTPQAGQPAPGIVAPATTKPLTAAEQSFAKVQEAMKGGDWPDSQDAKMESYQKLATARQKIAAEAASDEKGNSRKPHEIAAIVENKAPLPVVAKEPMYHPFIGRVKAGDLIPHPDQRTGKEMFSNTSIREDYRKVYSAMQSAQKQEIVNRVRDEHDATLPPAKRSSFVPASDADKQGRPGIAGTIPVNIDGKNEVVPVVTDRQEMRRLAPGSYFVLPDGNLIQVPKR